MTFTKEEFIERRVDDFETVDNFLRDMAYELELKDVPKKAIQDVIGYMYDLFEMPEYGFEEKKLIELKKRYKE